MSGDLGALLAAGKLSQRCPAPGCSVIEAAGSYSTCHGLPTGPADWFRQERGRPASVAREGARNGITGGLEQSTARTPTRATVEAPAT
jgi:hypothetical protein